MAVIEDSHEGQEVEEMHIYCTRKGSCVGNNIGIWSM